MSNLDLVQFQNLLFMMANIHPEIKGYMAGWAHEIENNRVNSLQNLDGEMGNNYPYLQWVFSPEGTVNLLETRSVMDVELRFYDVPHQILNVTQHAPPDDVEIADVSTVEYRTLVMKWRRLKRIGLEFLRGIHNIGIVNGVRSWDIRDMESVAFDMDSDLGINNLIMVRFTFQLEHVEECRDINWDFDVMPDPLTWYPSGIIDYEGYSDPFD